MAFTQYEVLPGVHHIQDDMGVSMTLLVGSERALLVDTGYGLEDVQAYVRTLTELPLTVVITHGHHDHCLGVRWFEETYMFPEDQQDFVTYTGAPTRKRIADSALAKGLSVDVDAFMTAAAPMPKPLGEMTLDLGGITAQIIHCPGHTPGSFVTYVPERALLLTADDWNPCTWLFFPAALDVYSYRSNLRDAMRLPFVHVLCSHQPVLFGRAKPEAFLAELTDEAIAAAHPVTIEPYGDINTHQLDMPDGQLLVFDMDKARRAVQA